jgi:hypothetical protein
MVLKRTPKENAKILYDFLWTDWTIKEFSRLICKNKFQIKKCMKNIEDRYIDNDIKLRFWLKMVDYNLYIKRLQEQIDYIKTLPYKSFWKWNNF